MDVHSMVRFLFFVIFICKNNQKICYFSNILQLSKLKPFDRDPLTIEEIEEFVKINEDYEKKVEKFYQKTE